MNQIALPGAQACDEPSARVDELRALYILTDRLYRARSMREVYDAALDAILGTLGCERASVLLFSDDGVMDFVTWRGLSDDYRTKLRGHSPWQPGARDPQPIFVADIDATLIIFESPRRVLATLADIERALGDRRVAVVREISKLHEQVVRGHVSEVIEKLDNPLGEFTLVVEGQTERPEPDDDEVIAAAKSLAEDGSSTRDITRRLQDRFAIPRRRAYELANQATGSVGEKR